MNQTTTPKRARDYSTSRTLFPTIEQLTSILESELASLQCGARASVASDDEESDEEADCMDVRLAIVTPDRMADAGWYVFTGSSDYDHLHGCACSSCTLPETGRVTRAELRAMARDMIGECREQLATAAHV